MSSSERLTDEQLRYERDFPIMVLHGSMAAELLALRARVLELEAALEFEHKEVNRLRNLGFALRNSLVDKPGG